jgi:hypothetical protein
MNQKSQFCGVKCRPYNITANVPASKSGKYSHKRQEGIFKRKSTSVITPRFLRLGVAAAKYRKGE